MHPDMCKPFSDDAAIIDLTTGQKERQLANEAAELGGSYSTEPELFSKCYVSSIQIGLPHEDFRLRRCGETACEAIEKLHAAYFSMKHDLQPVAAEILFGRPGE